MIKYEAEWSDYSGCEIKEVEVVKETAAQVVIQYKVKQWGCDEERTYERRAKKVSSNSVIVDTWEDAYDFISTRAMCNVKQARERLEHANKLFDIVRNMRKEPA